MFLRLFLFLSLISVVTPSPADEGREFLMSCTYGVLAGALVGAASLSIEEDPGEKIHRIARGASLGLYAGILLGLYVVYVVPAQWDQKEKEELEQVEDGSQDYGLMMEPPRLVIYPVVENRQFTGAGLQVNVLRF